MAILSKGHIPDNLALPIFEVFVQILLNVNLSRNQTPLAFLFYLRQTCITQMISL